MNIYMTQAEYEAAYDAFDFLLAGLESADEKTGEHFEETIKNLKKLLDKYKKTQFQAQCRRRAREYVIK